MAELEVQTLTKSAQVIGRDRLVEMKLLQPGIIIGTWRVISLQASIHNLTTIHWRILL